jgi:uncharacterized protein (DUF362 family)
MNECSRRNFLGLSGAIAVAGAVSPNLSGQEIPPPVPATPIYPFDARSPVSLIRGEDRIKNVTESLVAIDREIRPVLKRKKYVVIKVNNVATNNQLAATHVDALRGILEYLGPRFKGQVMIVESSAVDSLDGFEAYKYAQLIPEFKRFNLKLVDLNREGKYEVASIVDRNVRPIPVRLAARLLDPDAFIVSAAMPKTHNAVIATMSVKNMVMGAPLHAVAGQTPSWNDKRQMHAMGMPSGRGGMPGRGPAPARGEAPPAGAGAAPQTARGGATPARGGVQNRGAMFHAMNYNLAVVAKRLCTAWGCAVIDGFEGMEGNGPSNGTSVPLHVAMASPDLMAADRVALDVMDIPHHAIGYLQYAAQLGVGQYDIEKIDIRGEKPEAVKRKFKLANGVEQQLDWLNDIVRQG